MKIIYFDPKIELQCTSVKEAAKLFEGNKKYISKLQARLNIIETAEFIRDIINLPMLHFHNLENKNGKDLDGCFAIDLASRKDPWRIILQPLNEVEQPYKPCHIDQIAGKVKIVKIVEVSNYYD